MHYANSPLSKSPLNLPRIPGVTIDEDEEPVEPLKAPVVESSPKSPKSADRREDDNLFHMDD